MGEILTGDYLTFKAPLGGKGKIGMIGKSTQKTRSGKNVFNINNASAVNVTYAIDDNIVTATRENYEKTNYLTWDFKCKENTDYIFSLDVTVIKDQGAYTNSNTVGIRTTKGSGDWLSHIAVENDESSIGIKQHIEAQFNSSNYTSLYFWGYLCSMAGKEGEVEVKYENIMIREASVEDDSYEAYGAMPSPKFPSEIINFTGSINLFDGELETGSISTSTGENVDGARVRSKNYIEIPVNTSRLCFIRTITGGLTGMRFYDKNKNFLSSYNNTNRELANVQWFDVPQNTKYVRFVDFTNNLESQFKITTDLLSYKYSEPKKGILYIKNNCKNFINQEEIGNYNNNISYISRLEDGAIKSTSNFSNSRDAGTFLKLQKNTQYTVSVDIVSITTENGTVQGALGIMGHKPEIDSNIFGKIVGSERQIKSEWIGKRFSWTFNSGDYDFWTLHISGWYGSGFSGVLIYKNVQVEEGTEATEFKDGSQEFEFPLQEGQVLHEEDYLADDGIHNKRITIIFDGTESSWAVNTNATNEGYSHFRYNNYPNLNVESSSTALLCSHFKRNPVSAGNYINDTSGSNILYIGIDNNIIGVTDSDDNSTKLTKWKNWLANQYENGTPVTIETRLREEEIIPYTLEQQTIRNLMQNVALYEGTNNIFCTNEITPTLEVEISKLVDDFDFYISSNGYLVFPQYDKKYLTNMSENVILNMPEAVQTTVKIAGKDGDLVLDSSYNSQDFQVVMFTDEGLTPEQKEKERIFINRIFNAMKKNSKTFAFEQSQKFYKVLYSGILEETNYPQHMMFTIPLKSSKPYAYKMSSSYLLGNDTKTSETIEPVGFICTINGPALNPIISFNDYSMEFDNTISEGSKLIIDTNNSTAVLVNSNGIEINAMRYYNHQFPKIMEGENVLKVLSGIDNPNNVFISWYDLTL